MESRDAKPLTADEHLKFKAIVDHLTYNDERRQVSDALSKIGHPQGPFVQDAWQRVVRRMWRTF